MRLTALFMITILVTGSLASGQSRQQLLTGTTTDASTGLPLPGVNILNENSQAGTTSDLTGEFSLKMPENGAVIAFSYVGYKTERISFSGQLVMVVQLSPEVQTLEEVVLIGYGTIKKSDLTGAIASVSAKDIEKSSPVNIQSMLQGRVPGLMAVSNSGAPGSEATLRIRGIGTVNNNNPIYVVDGTLIDNTDANNPASNISFLNPTDIESVEVLKDASAQAIYGSRGANGVILISTRKGNEGPPKVTFSTTIGFSNAIKVPDVLNATEFKNMILTADSNGYLRRPDADPDAPRDTNSYAKETVARYNNGINTDWLDEVLKQNALTQNYFLSISGGTNNANYAASAGYLNNEGLIQKSGYQRYSFRLNA
jgi:TonB-linked SusC/RagA family outer membrane protein